MARLKLVLATVLLCGTALCVWRWYSSRPIEFVDADEVGGKKEQGPSDWFMAQRVWPEMKINPADYMAAVHTADRLQAGQRSLDDPTWIPAGPNNIGGRVSDIIGHPTNPNLFYLAAASGGIWKTTDGGNTWASIFDQSPSLSMGALAMDMAHPDTIYAGTGEACASGYSYFGSGVYRTTDGGATWANIGLGNSLYIARLVLDPEDTQSIWAAVMGDLYTAGSERGVYHSSDGGTSWQRSLFMNDSTGASDLILSPTNSQIVYAAMWQRIRSNVERRAGGRGSGIFRSTDSGGSWTRLDDGLPAQADTVGRIGLTVCQSNPNVLYAIYANHPGYFMGIYRSADGGNTWNRTNDASLQSIYSSYGWYFGNIRVRPDNSNVVFALGLGMARSTNAGQTWTEIANETHVDHHAMWFDPVHPTTILEGDDGGAYRSTNNGDNWTFLDGLPINQFYAATVDFQHPLRRYGGTQDQGTMRTMSGGLMDWQQIYGGDGFYALVDPTNSNIIYVEAQNGTFLARSDDGGGVFNDASNGLAPGERINWSMPVVFAPNNPATLYAGGQSVYRTTDRGNNWAAISPDLTGGGGIGNLVFGTISTIGVSAANPSVIYAGTDDSRVWVTRNGGGSWTDISAGLPQRWVTRVTPDPTDSTAVFVTISGFRNSEQNAHLFYSTNFGANWQNIGSDLPAGPLNDVVRDPSVPGRLYVASDLGAYYSNDLGAHWMTLGLGLPRVPVMQLVLHTPSHQMVAATYGRSMFTLDLSQLATDNSAHAVPSKYLLVSVYPNPFNALTTIDLDIPMSGTAELAVYDVVGRRVTTLLQGFQPAGHARLQWPAQNVASGTYFVKLTAAGQTRITKAFLIR